MENIDIEQLPAKSDIPRYGMGDVYYDWICPSCKKTVAFEPDIKGVPKRCQNCGQKLKKPESI